MSLYEYKFNMKYGVIDTTNTGRVTAWNEKPELSAKINMGCYVMEPEVFQLIPKNKQYGMDDVIQKALSKKKKIGSVTSKKGLSILVIKKLMKKQIECIKIGKI